MGDGSIYHEVYKFKKFIEIQLLIAASECFAQKVMFAKICNFWNSIVTDSKETTNLNIGTILWNLSYYFMIDGVILSLMFLRKEWFYGKF
jgi:hypothetical protein